MVFLPFLLVNVTKGSSILLIFSKKQLISLILCIFFNFYFVLDFYYLFCSFFGGEGVLFVLVFQGLHVPHLVINLKPLKNFWFRYLVLTHSLLWLYLLYCPIDFDMLCFYFHSVIWIFNFPVYLFLSLIIIQ